MIYNSCKHCGKIQEMAKLRLNKLKTKLALQIYEMQYGDTLDVKNKPVVTKLQLWEWQQNLEDAVKEL